MMNTFVFEAYQFLCKNLLENLVSPSMMTVADINKHILDSCNLHRVIEQKQKFSSSSFAKHVRFDGAA